MSDWHCKQIPSGHGPVVVCEKEQLRAERDTLREIVRAVGMTYGKTISWRTEPDGWGIWSERGGERIAAITPDQAERFGPVIDRAMEAPT